MLRVKLGMLEEVPFEWYAVDPFRFSREKVLFEHFGLHV